MPAKRRWPAAQTEADDSPNTICDGCVRPDEDGESATPPRDLNAVVGGLLRDLAFAQPTQPHMFGYKRTAAVVYGLEKSLTDLVRRPTAYSRQIAAIPEHVHSLNC